MSLLCFEKKKNSKFLNESFGVFLVFYIGSIFKTMMYTQGKKFHNALSNVVGSSYTFNVI